MRIPKAHFLLPVLLTLTLVVMQGCLGSQVSEQRLTDELGSPKALIPGKPAAPSSIDQKVGKVEFGGSSATGRSSDTRLGGNSAPKANVSAPNPSAADLAALTPEQKEQAIQQTLDHLSKGKFFHNVPAQMQVNRPILIEAGITKEVTAQLRQELQGQGGIVVREGVPYDPLGIDIRLSGDSADFKIQPIQQGKRAPIINDQPVIWSWQVTPLKRDIHYLTLIATVQVNVPELERSYSREYVVHPEPVMVKGRLDYSLQQFFINHWQSLITGTLLVGVGLFAWSIALGPRRHTADIQDEAGN
ncbi:hypothetical protein HY772_10120 [Candidatus Woesearchaeota archaeon]|nr:hypothetical protein [Candidatus Woesearchaeota archaeon]